MDADALVALSSAVLMENAVGQARGVLFQRLRELCEARHGAGRFAELVGQLAAADRAALEDGLFRREWGPIGTWNRLVDAYLARFHADDPDAGMNAYSAYLAEADLTSVGRIVLRLGSPDFMIERTGFLWRRYFSTGVYTATKVGPRHYTMELRGGTDIDRIAGRPTCACGPSPWLKKGFELAGFPNADIQHLSCRFDGLPACSYVARW